MSTPIPPVPADSIAPTAPALPAGRAPTHVWVAWVALALTIVAWLVVAMLWQRLGKTQEELARRSTDVQAEVAAARTLVNQAESVTQDLQARLGVAEVRLSEVSLQRSQLEELMLSVSRSRDDSLVQDLESALRLAVQQSQLTGSAQPLISALQAADQRIARSAQPRLNPVQRAIARDIERIRAASLVDVPALVSRIDDLVHEVDGWPLLNAPKAVVKTSTTRSARAGQGESQAEAAALPDTEGPTWQRWGAWWQAATQRWWASVQASATDLVRVSRIDRPEAALLAPDQAFFLRENLKLVLLNARMGLLARHLDMAQQDVQTAQRLLTRYFDAEAASTQLAQTGLKQLQRDLKQDSLPRPEDTLAALTAAAGGR